MPGNERDVVKVAAKTNKILFENDAVRVLQVTIQPGEKEPLHTHPYNSITIVEQPSRLKYFDEAGNEIEERELEGVSWVEPAQAHATENTGNHVFKGYRVELK